jgi:ATP-dependent DNA helicase PIF1
LSTLCIQIYKKNYLNVEYLKERAIVSPTNEIVDDVNMYILTLLPGEQREYLSADSISKCFDTCSDADVLYPIECLNSLSANNFPQHKLILKVSPNNITKKSEPKYWSM